MKKIKIGIFLIFVIFFALVIYQNLPYLVTKHALILDLHFVNYFNLSFMDFFNHYAFPEIENGLYFLGCFLAGLILAYISLLKMLFRSRSTVKTLNKSINEKQTEIDNLNDSLKKAEMASNKAIPEETSGEKTEA
ncbi:MAG: LapA family protein [Proteobacteria bacterium]|nr:LapA family protein [Pseudomonadota bacterium]